MSFLRGQYGILTFPQREPILIPISETVAYEEHYIGATLSKRIRTLTITISSIIGVLLFAVWAWHGSISSFLRLIVASASWKLFLFGAVVAMFGLVYAMRKRRAVNWNYYSRTPARPLDDASPETWNVYRAYQGFKLGRLTAIFGGVIMVLSMIVTPLLGGMYQASVVAESVTTVDAPQDEYKWRTPWTVAANSVSSRAGNIVGDFISDSTTYMPSTKEFITPVQGRGFATGIVSAVSQQGQATAKVCKFTSEVPVTNGMFSMNLKRALSFVDPSLFYTVGDEWVYCDNDKAVLVVPVMRMVGQPESTPVPAGVVMWDGQDVVFKENVKKGELPGPVYPSSLAAAQRDSLTSASGIMDKIFNRAGYETSEDVDGDPNNGNASEILLERVNGGWDYLTPLTPRGKSFTITALAIVPADEVTAGKLNPMTIHTLAAPREGNQAIADRIKAMFPNLGWAAGLKIVEVVPTSTTAWEATLSNGRAVANRITIADDGTMCLLTSAGAEVSCVNPNGAAASGQPAPAGSTAPVPVDSELSQLTDAELAELAVRVANEQLLRANQ